MSAANHVLRNIGGSRVGSDVATAVAVVPTPVVLALGSKA